MFLITDIQIQARITLGFYVLIVALMSYVLYQELFLNKDFLNKDLFKKKKTLGLVLFIFLSTSCQKIAENSPSVSAQNIELADIQEDLETIEPDTLETEIEPYEPESAATKIVSVIGQKGRNITWGTCDTTKIRYLDYYIAHSNYEFIVNFSKPDTVLSITATIGNDRYCDVGIIEQEPTSCTVEISNIVPQYKARSVRFTFNMKNGKPIKKSLKMIPSYVGGNVYGTSRYNVAYNLMLVDRISNTNYNLSNLADRDITAQTSFNLYDILVYNQNHFGLIVKSPELKTIKVNGVPTAMWVLRIREANAFCDNRIKTRTIKVLPGAAVPSINPDIAATTKFKRL
jgi:hypothetical protein